jgi:hypothetical protein
VNLRHLVQFHQRAFVLQLFEMSLGKYHHAIFFLPEMLDYTYIAVTFTNAYEMP